MKPFRIRTTPVAHDARQLHQIIVDGQVIRSQLSPYGEGEAELYVKEHLEGPISAPVSNGRWHNAQRLADLSRARAGGVASRRAGPGRPKGSTNKPKGDFNDVSYEDD